MGFKKYHELFEFVNNFTTIRGVILLLLQSLHTVIVHDQFSSRMAVVQDVTLKFISTWNMFLCTGYRNNEFRTPKPLQLHSSISCWQHPNWTFSDTTSLKDATPLASWTWTRVLDAGSRKSCQVSCQTVSLHVAHNWSTVRPLRRDRHNKWPSMER